ncbi:hypothetical protein FNF27_02594 [Cafeteria roenbergensis]|uniref:WH1 domain-containing protein n=2 Tax=Cafeteria roenbergensis TaxID=33653 RepID=A0A5A8D844_CAFRO|nr:hypothetical protein FNF28_05003 [Cafeteria roenbergensis]KAA0175873.1 hypothetical protein FNF27_02594 [Cafeteria roenbergensis]
MAAVAADAPRLTTLERRHLSVACGGELLACAVARVLLATPDPTSWTPSGIEGALCLVFDPSCDAHLFRVFGMGPEGQGASSVGEYHLRMEVELYDDPRFFDASAAGGAGAAWAESPGEDGSGPVVHAFETDDFMMGFEYSCPAEAAAMLDAVAAKGPRQDADRGRDIIAAFDVASGRLTGAAAAVAEDSWLQRRRRPSSWRPSEQSAAPDAAVGSGQATADARPDGVFREALAQRQDGLRKVDRQRRGTTTRLPGQTPGRRRVSIAKMTASAESSLVNRLQAALHARRHVIQASNAIAEDSESGSDWSEDSDVDS